MKYRRFMMVLMATLLVGFVPIGTFANTLYQAGTFISLADGILTGSTSLSDLMRQGDFGLGTINGINGEMSILDGKAYLSDNTGHAVPISLKNKTPFALVTHFVPDQTFILRDIDSFDALTKAIDQKLPSQNYIYAIKITGKFNFISFRALDRQHKPYVSYSEWVKIHQHIINLQNVNATVIAFKTPEFIHNLSMAGYHLHFITDDKQIVGHIYNLGFKEATVSIEVIKNLQLSLPTSTEFSSSVLPDMNNNAVIQLQQNKKPAT